MVRIAAVAAENKELEVNESAEINDLSEEYLDDEIEECSLDNLDACFQDSLEECSIDDLDACMERENYRPPLSLRAFMSQPIIEVQLAFLVVLSSLFVGIGTLYSIPPMLMVITHYGELLISAIFTVEYFVRWKLNNFSAK